MTTIGDEVLNYVEALKDPEKYNSKKSCTGAFLDMIPDQDQLEDDGYILDLIDSFQDVFCEHKFGCKKCEFYDKLSELKKEAGEVFKIVLEVHSGMDEDDLRCAIVRGCDKQGIVAYIVSVEGEKDEQEDE